MIVDGSIHELLFVEPIGAVDIARSASFAEIPISLSPGEQREAHELNH
jgi:hypothetical protein